MKKTVFLNEEEAKMIHVILSNIQWKMGEDSLKQHTICDGIFRKINNAFSLPKPQQSDNSNKEIKEKEEVKA